MGETLPKGPRANYMILEIIANLERSTQQIRLADPNDKELITLLNQQRMNLWHMLVDASKVRQLNVEPYAEADDIFNKQSMGIRVYRIMHADNTSSDAEILGIIEKEWHILETKRAVEETEKKKKKKD